MRVRVSALVFSSTMMQSQEEAKALQSLSPALKGWLVRVRTLCAVSYWSFEITTRIESPLVKARTPWSVRRQSGSRS